MNDEEFYSMAYLIALLRPQKPVDPEEEGFVIQGPPSPHQIAMQAVHDRATFFDREEE